VTVASGLAYAQDNGANTGNDAPAVTGPENPAGRQRDRQPVDLEKFSRLDALKSADKDNDGTLSREELEAYALDRLVQRMANRMERRLDVNGDGVVTVDEIEKQRGKEFAALDRNDDGVLDRSELRAGKQFHQDRHHQRGPGQHRGPRG
jgi:Ca2+-binding EF-hand superfamily protein